MNQIRNFFLELLSYIVTFLDSLSLNVSVDKDGNLNIASEGWLYTFYPIPLKPPPAINDPLLPQKTQSAHLVEILGKKYRFNRHLRRKFLGACFNGKEMFITNKPYQGFVDLPTNENVNLQDFFVRKARSANPESYPDEFYFLGERAQLVGAPFVSFPVHNY